MTSPVGVRVPAAQSMITIGKRREYVQQAINGCATHSPKDSGYMQAIALLAKEFAKKDPTFPQGALSTITATNCRNDKKWLIEMRQWNPFVKQAVDEHPQACPNEGKHWECVAKRAQELAKTNIELNKKALGSIKCQQFAQHNGWHLGYLPSLNV